MYVSDTPDMEYNTYESNYEYDKCNINIIYSQGYPFNVEDREMRLTLQEMAQNRIPPFD